MADEVADDRSDTDSEEQTDERPAIRIHRVRMG
jgi:hypothetical protein